MLGNSRRRYRDCVPSWCTRARRAPVVRQGLWGVRGRTTYARLVR